MSEVQDRVAVLLLHPGCNMHCDFCITDSRFSSMTFEQGVEALERLQARGFGNVVLGGGEPLAWRHDLLALAAQAKAMGFVTQVGTNGVALPADFEHLACFDRYVLPMDAASAALHNQLRHYRGRHHQIIMERLERLRIAGRTVTVSTVVTALNRHALPSIADWLEAYAQRGGSLHAWHLYKFLPYGRGGARQAETLGVGLEAYQTACEAVCSRDLPFRVYKRPDMRHSRNVDFFWFEGNELRAGSEAWSVQAPTGDEAAFAMGWPCEAASGA